MLATFTCWYSTSVILLRSHIACAWAGLFTATSSRHYHQTCLQASPPWPHCELGCAADAGTGCCAAVWSACCTADWQIFCNYRECILYLIYICIDAVYYLYIWNPYHYLMYAVWLERAHLHSYAHLVYGMHQCLLPLLAGTALAALSPCLRLGRHLHSNQITTLPSNVFANLTSLTTLWVGMCCWCCYWLIFIACSSKAKHCKLSPL